jgi:hypothetical protein
MHIYQVLCQVGCFLSDCYGSEDIVLFSAQSGSFNNKAGQAGCTICGASATSSPGSTTCRCKGANRSFQQSYQTCICKPGYEFYQVRGLSCFIGGIHAWSTYRKQRLLIHCIA